MIFKLLYTFASSLLSLYPVFSSFPAERITLLLAHLYLHHHLLHLSAYPAGRHPRIVGILQKDTEKKAIANDHIEVRAVGIECKIRASLYGDGLGNLRKWLATHHFRTDDRNLYVDIPQIGLIPLFVRWPPIILATMALMTISSGWVQTSASGMTLATLSNARTIVDVRSLYRPMLLMWS